MRLSDVAKQGQKIKQQALYSRSREPQHERGIVMNKLKRVLVLLMVVAVASFCLTGCNKHEHPEGEHPTKDAASEEHPAGEHPEGEHPE